MTVNLNTVFSVLNTFKEGAAGERLKSLRQQKENEAHAARATYNYLVGTVCCSQPTKFKISPPNETWWVEYYVASEPIKNLMDTLYLRVEDLYKDGKILKGEY